MSFITVSGSIDSSSGTALDVQLPIGYHPCLASTMITGGGLAAITAERAGFDPATGRAFYRFEYTGELHTFISYKILCSSEGPTGFVTYP